MSSRVHDLDETVEDQAFYHVEDETHAKASWLDRFSVASKLRLAIVSNALILILISGVTLAGALYWSSTGLRLSDMATVEIRSAHATIELNHASQAMREYREGTDIARFADVPDHLASAEEHFASALAGTSEDLPQDLREELQGFEQEISALAGRVNSLGNAPAANDVRAIETSVVETQGEMASFAQSMRARVLDASSELFSGINSMLIFAAVLIGSAIVIAFGGARAIIRNVAGMITAITESMESLAIGDTEVHIPGRARGDEIGAMARSLEVFREGSLELRRRNEMKIERSSQLRAEKSELLEGLADGFDVSVGEVINAVSAASDQLKSTSHGMVKLAEDSTKQSQDASGAMNETSRNVTAAAAATDEFALSIGEISRQASASAKLARDASELVSAANEKMTDPSGAADQIGDIVELIQAIAQRTNLLALNAAIEAARGGEAGRGFAVVASEVKELASQTSDATNNVSAMIETMQSSTSASVEDLTSIVKQINDLEQASVVIAAAVDQQSTSGDDLARNLDTVASGTSDIEGQLGHLREASVATGCASGEVLQSANELGSHADALRKQANQFLESIRRNASELEADEMREESPRNAA